ncbi:hypothetical protein HYW54_03925 [Candidatus Gottesmanbacteria bacterium]|nr:hypothetical protein [Candidatus Gottesmanbacteria bacterium]
MPSPLELNKEHFSSDSNREFAIYKSVIQTKPQLSNNCQLLGLEITPSTPYVDIGNIIEVRNSRISLGLIVTEFEMGSRKPIFDPFLLLSGISMKITIDCSFRAINFSTILKINFMQFQTGKLMK